MEATTKSYTNERGEVFTLTSGAEVPAELQGPELTREALEAHAVADADRAWSKLSPFRVRVFLVNFGWFTPREFDTLAEALEDTKRHAYEVSFWRGDARLGSWSVFGGFRAR